MKSKLMFFDIETVADPVKIALLPEPTAPKNLKDPEKIAIAVKEKKEEQVTMAALDPDIAIVNTIVYRIKGGGLTAPVQHAPPKTDYVTLQVSADMPEEQVLSLFWNAYAEVAGTTCGYNIMGFDIPFLMRRSMALGIRIPVPVNLAKYRSFPTVDLFALLYNWGIGKSMKVVAKLYGLEVLEPEKDGSMVADMTPEERARYCKSDVYIVEQLFDRMNGIYFNIP